MAERACLDCGRPFESRNARHRRCPAHEPHGREATGSPSNRAQDAEYVRNRAIVLAGDPLCYWGCGRPATTAEHLAPVSRGGTNDLSNIVAACAPCNYSRRDNPDWRPRR